MIPHCGRGPAESGVKPPHSKARSARENIGVNSCPFVVKFHLMASVPSFCSPAPVRLTRVALQDFALSLHCNGS
jgi:hypothetical protein